MKEASPSSTLYVSDLDGTLLGADSRISAASVEMLKEAISRGATFTVATARTPATVAGILEGITLPVPAIVMTGAALWDQSCNIFVSPRFIPEETVREMIRIYQEGSLSAFIYSLKDNKIHIHHIGEMTPLGREFINSRAGNPFKELHPEGSMPDDLSKVLLFYAMNDPEKAEPVYLRLRDEVQCNPVYYFDIFGPGTAILEVFAEGVSKAAAIENLASRYGLERVVAFGDNVNDIPMLSAADVAVAVGNALPQVRDMADEVIGENTSDAVPARILQDFSL